MPTVNPSIKERNRADEATRKTKTKAPPPKSPDDSDARRRAQDEMVDEASDESFPASDAPPWPSGRARS